MRALCAIVLLAACGDVPPPRQTITFDRPDRMSFVCLNVAENAGRPMSACDTERDVCTDGQDPLEGECRDTGASLHGLVLQSTRGEMSVVDFDTLSDTDDDDILDVDRVVPGYSSHAVGLLPVAVAVRSADVDTSGEVYVASADPRSPSVMVVPVSHLREISGEAPRTFALSDVPSDMALDSQQRLVVSLPEEGALVLIDPETGEEVGCVALGAPTDEGGKCAGWVDSDAGPDAGDPDAGAGDAGPGDAGEAGPSDSGPDAFAHPIAIALAADGNSVWVADIGTHLIWHVDLTAPGILDSVDVGVTTRAIAVSPDGRWVYAVDAEFGQVMVVDVEARAVLDPNLEPLDPLAEGRGIPIPGLATEVLFLRRDDPLEDEEEAHPDRLNGLFGLVASSNGFVYVVDVQDLDVESGARPVQDESDPENRFEFAPHHLRSAFILTEANAPRIGSVPALGRNDGSRDTGCELVCLQPHFEGVCGPEFCEDRRDPADAVVDDFGITMRHELEDERTDSLWRTTNERWDVVFEGPLPGSTRSRGRVEEEGGDALIDERTDFCRLGVEPGDSVVILQDPLLPEEMAPGCDEVDCSGQLLGDDDFGVEATVAPGGVSSTRLDVLDWPEDAACCFGEFTRYQVRLPAGNWIVVGTDTGYLHPWTSRDGACEIDSEIVDIDPDLDGVQHFLSGRVATSERFENPYLSFTILPGDETLGPNSDAQPQRDDAYSFDTAGSYAGLAIPGGSMIGEIIQAPVGDRLYVVDSARGVIEVSLATLDITQEFR